MDEELPEIRAVCSLLKPEGDGFFLIHINDKIQFNMPIKIENKRLREQGAPDYFFENLNVKIREIMKPESADKVLKMIHLYKDKVRFRG